MGLDKNLAKKCCQACINTYNGHYGKAVEMYRPTDFKINHVEGHWGILYNNLFIVFKGSHGKADWIDNFKFWKEDVRKTKPYGNLDSDIEVHAGFIEQYKQVRDIIHDIVKSHPSFDIVVTGHSLGGAIATLCAVDIQYNFDKNVQCFTFGSPRVGNKAFADSFIKRVPNSYRYDNGSDIVTTVPIWGYAHVANKVKIGKHNIFRMFEDHRPDNYLRNI